MSSPQEKSNEAMKSLYRSLDGTASLPALFLWFCSACWLVFGSAMALIASIKMHSPALLENSACFTYGKLVPVASASFLYGFATQAGLAASISLICRMGRTELFQPGLIFLGSITWNLSLKLGILGIFAGQYSGFEAFELPKQVFFLMMFSYLVMGGLLMVTFHYRTVRDLYPSQWMVLAALIWFPWVFSVAGYLLLCSPPRGVIQTVVSYWYASNFKLVVLGLLALAVNLWLLPRTTRQNLPGGKEMKFAFWTFIFFGSLSGIPYGLPVPAWIPALSGLAGMFLVLPVLVIVRAGDTLVFSKRHVEVSEVVTYRFLFFSVLSFIGFGVLYIMNSYHSINELLRFTFVTSAMDRLLTHGFIGMALMGSAYYLAPRLAGLPLPSPKLASLHLGLSVAGLVLYVVPMLLSGIGQGIEFTDPAIPFGKILETGMLGYRNSTLGDLLHLGGTICLAWNLVLLVVGACRKCCSNCCKETPNTTSANTVEASA